MPSSSLYVCLSFVMLRFCPLQELSRTSLHDLFDALTAAYGAVFGLGNCTQESEAASLLTAAAVNQEEGVCTSLVTVASPTSLHDDTIIC